MSALVNSAWIHSRMNEKKTNTKTRNSRAAISPTTMNTQSVLSSLVPLSWANKARPRGEVTGVPFSWRAGA